MKKLLFIISAGIIICSCNSAQNDATKQAEGIKEAVKQNSPGSIPTSSDGYTMTAKIDGKDWKATDIMPPDKAGLIVGENNGESISLPYYDRKNFLANKTTKLNGVDMRLNDNVGLWTGSNGEMELTKVDDKWAEGTFHFTAKGFQTDKKIEVTDGFFRISLSDKQ